MSLPDMTPTELEALRHLWRNDAVRNMIASESPGTLEPEGHPLSEPHRVLSQISAIPAIKTPGRHAVEQGQPTKRHLQTEDITESPRVSFQAQSRKQPRHTAATSAVPSSAPRKPVSARKGASSGGISTRKEASSRSISAGTARRDGNIRGTGIRPSRGSGYIAHIPSSRPPLQKEAPRYAKRRKDIYSIGSDNDSSYPNEINSDESTRPSPYMGAADANAPPLGTFGQPRRSLRQTSVRPGSYVIPTLEDDDEDENALSPSPTSPSFPPSIMNSPTTKTTSLPSRNATPTQVASSVTKKSLLVSLPVSVKQPSASNMSVSDTETEIAEPPPPIAPRKFVIGLDYGTTFTSPQDSNRGAREQVPTEIWYSSEPPVRDSDTESEEEEEIYDGRSRRHNSSRPRRDSAWTAVNDHIHGSCSTSNDFLWGYQVHYQVYRSNTRQDTMRRVERPKLMLVDTTHTDEDRQRLRPRLEYLIKNGFIRKYGAEDNVDERDVQDVISDFLTKVLSHTKQQLIELEDLTPDCPISFALTVPTVWSPGASRVMQTAVEKAIRAAKFGTLRHGSVDNLFIVLEPEAGATFAMAGSRQMLANTFICMDCGGGTVDTVTYQVANSYPLRLKKEIGKPAGDNCGASYLNENFEKRLLERLSGESELECNGQTLEGIVRYAVPDFEDYQKREVDIARRPNREVRIPGLEGDSKRLQSGRPAKRFGDNCVLLNVDDYNSIFLPLLRRAEILLRGQIQTAIEEKKEVKKVFLIGGFGAAPSLRSHLKSFLARFAKEVRLAYEIKLAVLNEQSSVTAIASGAVLRALNLEQGPQRIARSSYGFLRLEPYQPKVEPGHEEAELIIDQFLGKLYVKVIDYFMLKGDVIPAVCEYPPFETTHAFAVDEPQLLCEEVLYVNDSSEAESCYSVSHRKNKDAQVAGKIIVDMTRLRDENKIQPAQPVAKSGSIRGQIHYKVNYDLVAIVEARNLRYEARYPSGENGRVQETGQVCIAAAFEPGTG
ncbi:hypothetical protein BDZ45DRAFT_752274 [Acephala macrosclerotiorum]|nr:hypothetical protein BDZ45DRAFT_752274 [Acephala macrosclerotiorum]